MPPRRPPPLLPKARLLEAINAIPTDNRTTPKEVSDSRIVLLGDAGAVATSLPEPWHAAPSKENNVSPSKSAGYPVAPVTGCTYYSQNMLAMAVSGTANATIHSSFLYTTDSNNDNIGNNTDSSSIKHVENTSQVANRGFIGITQTMRDVEPMQSSVDNSPSGSASKQVIVLELAQGPSASVDLVSLSRLPELLQSKGLTSAEGSGSSTRIILGNMGYPDLKAVFDGKRGFLETYEKTLSELAFCPNVYWQFSGYLSLLPPDKVDAAFQEISSGSPNGGEAYKACKKAVSAFFAPVLEAFGEDRIIWGSDWPRFKSVIAASAKPTQDEWRFALKLALDVVCDIGLRGDSLDKIFHTNASTLIARTA